VSAELLQDTVMRSFLLRLSRSFRSEAVRRESKTCPSKNAAAFELLIDASKKAYHILASADTLTVTLSGLDIFRQIVIRELSEFEMDDVPKGYYTLTIRSSELNIVNENVDI
jgi:hypothetical protein